MSLAGAHISAVGNCGSLSSLPVELLEGVYCPLPSFNDVFSLSSTCHQMRDVWLNNVATIYNRVARASIPCKRYARAFFADQGGPSLESGMISAKDVVKMLRNKRVLDAATQQFESEIVGRVKARGHRTEDYYGAGALQHPPYLTRTERTRFIRAYYLFWGLMMSDHAEWQSRLQSMSLKRLIQLCEISWLPEDIKPGEQSGSSLQSSDIGANTLPTKLSMMTTTSTPLLPRLPLTHPRSASTPAPARRTNQISVFALDRKRLALVRRKNRLWPGMFSMGSQHRRPPSHLRSASRYASLHRSSLGLTKQQRSMKSLSLATTQRTCLA